MPPFLRDDQPAFYNDLAATLGEAWRLLVRAAADRRAPMHTPAVATVGTDGQPHVRTVVLRHTDPIERTLRFHTDARCGKVADILAQPAVQIAAYDPGHKVQLRVSGRALVHVHDVVAFDAWKRSQAQSQLCYRQLLPPGSSSSDRADLTAPADHDGQQNFSAVVVHIHEIDWLYLASSGHRRARFRWSPERSEQTCEAHWLAP